MAWQDKFLIHFGPGLFSGITLRDWFRILRENRFSVDSPHWLRAAAITLGSLQNSAIAGLEKAIYGRKIESAEVHPPLFVLGLWRSGTTHLHNLLSRDDRFAFPSIYQVMFPHTFLLTEKTNSKLFGLFMPQTRPQDNMRITPREPSEDELALCAMTQCSFLISWAFPRRAAHYDRFLTFTSATESDIEIWKLALMQFIKKLSFKYNRPLVLKSPGHTCRIRLLLELFPNAKFVHIHRHPYRVLQSSYHAVAKILPYWKLQRINLDDGEEHLIQLHTDAYDAFFQQRDLIPDGRLHELAFDELESDPIGQMRQVYERLDLPDFSYIEPRLREYVESLSGYRKNTFPDLPAELRQRIAFEWRRCFDEWGYSTYVRNAEQTRSDRLRSGDFQRGD